MQTLPPISSRPVKLLPDDSTRGRDFSTYAALILRAGSLGAARRLAEAEPNLSPRVRGMLSTKAVGAATASDLVAAVPGFLSASTEFLASLRSIGLFDSMLPSMQPVPRRTRAVTATLVSASSVAETAYKPVSELSLAGPALVERKASAIVVWSRELAELIGSTGRALFEAELRRGVVAGTDSIFIPENCLKLCGGCPAIDEHDFRGFECALDRLVELAFRAGENGVDGGQITHRPALRPARMIAACSDAAVASPKRFFSAETVDLNEPHGLRRSQPAAAAICLFIPRRPF